MKTVPFDQRLRTTSSGQDVASHRFLEALAAIGDGAPASSAFFFMGDEHAALIAPGHDFALGDRVTLSAPHCDPTVNLYDAYPVVRGETLLAIWPVSARGRSR